MSTEKDEQPDELHLTVRGWKNGVLAFAEAHTFKGEFNELGEDISTMAARQIARVADAPLHMIEIEFMDEPDQKKRFCRFGTDRSRMVAPVAVELEGDERANFLEVGDDCAGLAAEFKKPSVH